MSRSCVSLGVEKAPVSQDTDHASESGRGEETETRWGNLALDYGKEVRESPAPGLGLERPLWMVGEGSLLGWLDAGLRRGAFSTFRSCVVTNTLRVEWQRVVTEKSPGTEVLGSLSLPRLGSGQSGLDPVRLLPRTVPFTSDDVASSASESGPPNLECLPRSATS